MDWDAIELLKTEAELHRLIAGHLVKMIQQRLGASEALLMVEQFRSVMHAQMPIDKDRDVHEQFDRILDRLSQLTDPQSKL